MTMRLAVAALVACALAGCASMEPPKPWERGNLARPDMQFDYDRLAARLRAALGA